jgi:hypothetical protein
MHIIQKEFYFRKIGKKYVHNVYVVTYYINNKILIGVLLY